MKKREVKEVAFKFNFIKKYFYKNENQLILNLV